MPNVESMIVRAAKPPFGKPGWLWELKVDGCRLMAYIDGQRIRLVTRRGRNATSQFPDLAGLHNELVGVETAILDGELVACGDDGKPDSGRLQQRLRSTSWRRVRLLSKSIPVCLVAFDLLYLNGADLRGLPLVDRKERLRAVIPPEQEHITFSEDWDATDGEALYKAVWDQRLEGVVAKAEASRYISGRPNHKWLKAKTRFARDIQGHWPD